MKGSSGSNKVVGDNSKTTERVNSAIYINKQKK